MITQADIRLEATQKLTEMLRQQRRRYTDALTPEGIRAVCLARAADHERKAAGLRRLAETVNG